MGDTIKTLREAVTTATRINADRFDRLVDDAEAAFWAELARAVPEARTGDMPPDASAVFTSACARAVAAWLIANVNPTPTTGAASVRVELRAPRAGERGWWVLDDSSPTAALREVMCESEELGFDVSRDDSYADQTYDEQGMRIVTVIVEAEPKAAPTPEQAWDKLKDLP